MSNKIATITFTFDHDMQPVILKLEGSLYQKEILEILKDIQNTYTSEVDDNWMQGKVVVYESSEDLEEGESGLEFEYDNVFLN